MVFIIIGSAIMETGMRYAWRVTVFDIAGTIPFEQKGEIEICTFTYKASCDSVSNLANKTAERSCHFTWDVGPMHTSYNVEMRNPATALSKNSETYENSADFFGLEYGSVGCNTTICEKFNIWLDTDL